MAYQLKPTDDEGTHALYRDDVLVGSYDTVKQTVSLLADAANYRQAVKRWLNDNNMPDVTLTVEGDGTVPSASGDVPEGTSDAATGTSDAGAAGVQRPAQPDASPVLDSAEDIEGVKRLLAVETDTGVDGEAYGAIIQGVSGDAFGIYFLDLRRRYRDLFHRHAALRAQFAAAAVRQSPPLAGPPLPATAAPSSEGTGAGAVAVEAAPPEVNAATGFIYHQHPSFPDAPSLDPRYGERTPAFVAWKIANGIS
jgi:hypothetical protein